MFGMQEWHAELNRPLRGNEKKYVWLINEIKCTITMGGKKDFTFISFIIYVRAAMNQTRTQPMNRLTTRPINQPVTRPMTCTWTMTWTIIQFMTRPIPQTMAIWPTPRTMTYPMSRLPTHKPNQDLTHEPTYNSSHEPTLTSFIMSHLVSNLPSLTSYFYNKCFMFNSSFPLPFFRDLTDYYPQVSRLHVLVREKNI